MPVYKKDLNENLANNKLQNSIGLDCHFLKMKFEENEWKI